MYLYNYKEVIIMNKKKIIASVLSLVLITGTFASCGNASTPGKKNDKELEKSPEAVTIIAEKEKTTAADVTAITAAVDPSGKVLDNKGITDISGHKVYSTGQKDNGGRLIYTTGKKASNGKILYTKNTKDSFGKQIYYTGAYGTDGKLYINPTTEVPDYTTNDKPSKVYNTTNTTTTTKGYKTTSKLVPADAAKNYIKYFGGTGLDIFRAITPCKDGGYAAAAYTNSKNGSLDGVNKDWAGSAAIVKYSAKGDQTWKYVLGGDGEIMPEGVTELKDGSIVAVGSTSATDTAAPLNCKLVSTFIVRLDKDGKLIWMYTFPGDEEQEGDYATSVAATPDGGFVVGGKSNSTAGFFNGGKASTAYLFKFDKNCNVKWRKTLAGSKSNHFDGLSVADNGDIYTTCITTSSDDDFAGLIKGQSYTNNTVLMKFSKNGDLKWSKNLDSTGNSELDSVYATADGGCVVAGSYKVYKRADGIYTSTYGKSDGFVIRYDADGSVCWAHHYGGANDDTVTGITAIDNGFAITGKTKSVDRDFQGYVHGGDTDSFVMLLDELGNVCAVYLLDGSKTDTSMCICTLGDGTVTMAGSTMSPDNEFKGSGTNGQAIAYAANFSIKTAEKTEKPAKK